MVKAKANRFFVVFSSGEVETMIMNYCYFILLHIQTRRSIDTFCRAFPMMTMIMIMTLLLVCHYASAYFSLCNPIPSVPLFPAAFCGACVMCHFRRFKGERREKKGKVSHYLSIFCSISRRK